LLIYFAALIGLTIAVLLAKPEILQYLPLGGSHALGGASTSALFDAASAILPLQDPVQGVSVLGVDAAENIGRLLLFLVGHIGGTLLVMIPITWTYMAVMHKDGYSKTFVRSLIILPICATTIVLIIQDRLALAFGLAALVASVRFSIRLDKAIDGVFVFSAVCVGLSSGVGYVGIAVVMGAIFCFANLGLWWMDYGQNALDEKRLTKKRSKLDAPSPGHSD